MDVFLGRGQSTTCLANLAPGKPIAVALGSPTDYRAMQIKGTVAECQGADSEDALWLDPQLRLSFLRDNLETRLLLLRRRLDDRGAPIRLLRTARGQLRLRVDGMVDLTDAC
jgi:hypothetical protein